VFSELRLGDYDYDYEHEHEQEHEQAGCGIWVFRRVMEE
jgi:hypothetical protein